MADMDKWRQAVSTVLTAGEQIVDMTTGSVTVVRMGKETKRHGAVAVTDRRVILYTKKIGGYDVHDFAYGLLSSVNHKKGVFQGNLTLAASGNATLVNGVPNTDVERIAQAIRDRMAIAHQSGQAGATPVGSPPADQIRELAKLRDEGLISSEEFEEKKRQLLGL